MYKHVVFMWVRTGFSREVAENCTLLGHYTASGGDVLPMFRDKISVPSLGVQRTAFFWVITHLVVVIYYRRFEINNRFHLQGSRELHSSGLLHI